MNTNAKDFRKPANVPFVPKAAFRTKFFNGSPKVTYVGKLNLAGFDP